MSKKYDLKSTRILVRGINAGWHINEVFDNLKDARQYARHLTVTILKQYNINGCWISSYDFNKRIFLF